MHDLAAVSRGKRLDLYASMYLLLRATGGIRLTASGPVLVQQPAAAGRVRASWQRRAYAPRVPLGPKVVG